jgi:RNA polymerase sigma factor (sigma-70 family)
MTPTDADLVRRYLDRREEQAFRALLERHAGPALRTAHRITGDLAAAEDAVQETFLAVMRGLSRFDARRSFRAWTVGIAIKCATKQVRERARRQRREENRPMETPHQPTPHEGAERREIDTILKAALDGLPAPRRVALHLHYREGLSLAEVAQALGISTGTAKSRIARGLEDLRGRLGQGALGAALLPDLLARLPGPSPTPALLEACAGKAFATGPAVAMPLAKKLVAACLLAGAGTVAAVGLIGDDGHAPRSARPPEVASRPVAEPPAGAADDAPPGEAAQRAESAPGADPETRPVAAPPAPGGETGGAGGPERAGAAGAERKVWRPEDLPKETQVVRGGGGKEPGTGMQRGPAPGRLQPAQRASSKFAQPPRYRGEATIRGRVIDADGRPVEGAAVCRMPIDVDRSEGTILSFEFIAEIGKTGADGTFEATKQEHGTFYLVANYARLMNRPRGMETRDAVVVQVAEKGTAEGITLKIPVQVGELVPLRGVVTDAEGRPVQGAQVFVDYQELRTDAEGRFDAGKVPVGTRNVVVRRTGYQELEGTVEAARGQENVAQLVLELKEQGELRLAGQVLDQAGTPVAGGTVYLNAPNATVRNVKTDAQGRYAFDKLPARLGEGGCTVTVWADGHFPKHVKEVPVPMDPFEIRVDRAVRLVVKVVSGATGEPLQQIRGEARREIAEGGKVEYRMFRSWSVFKEDGILDDLDVPTGKVQLELEAPGHAVTTVEVGIAAGDEKKEIEVRLQPSAEGGE